MLTPPTDFSKLVLPGRKLAEEYARERGAVVEPYRAVVVAFKGQENTRALRHAPEPLGGTVN